MLRRTLVAACILLITTAVYSQSLEQQLQRDLQKKIFTVRNFYASDTLHFDSTGQLIGTPEIAYWTLASFAVKDVKVEGPRLVLRGHHAGHVYNPKDRALELYRLPKKMEIELDLPPDITLDGAKNLLDVVFYREGESFIAQTPAYWHPFLNGEFRDKRNGQFAPNSIPDEVVNRPEGERIGKRIKPPITKSTLDPTYPPLAKTAGIKGKLVLWIVVGADGRVHSIAVETPFGLGCDDRAVEAVSKWTFAPATKDGRPVAVQVHVEPHFEL